MSEVTSAPDGLRRCVLLLYGGRSSEHPISCATAAGVLEAIDRDRFDVIPVGITRDGAWTLPDARPESLGDGADELPEVTDNGTRVLLPDAAGNRRIRVEREGRIDDLGDIDVVLPLLHGKYGEDGTLQGALELLDLPYVGSGVLAAAAGMDKHTSKLLFAAAGLAVADGVTVAQSQWDGRPADTERWLIERIGFPMFVKPSRAGSSVGVSKVAEPDGIAEAMRIAFAEDDRVLVERAVTGREVEIAILEGRPGERPRASLPGEIKLTGAEFYDFATKYLGAAGVELVCPAPMSEAERDEMAQLGIRAFEALGASGLARADFFLTDEGFVINEVNTMPGFTPISMFPACWQASGLAYADLITELIEVALARHAARPNA